MAVAAGNQNSSIEVDPSGAPAPEPTPVADDRCGLSVRAIATPTKTPTPTRTPTPTATPTARRPRPDAHPAAGTAAAAWVARSTIVGSTSSANTSNPVYAYDGKSSTSWYTTCSTVPAAAFISSTSAPPGPSARSGRCPGDRLCRRGLDPGSTDRTTGPRSGPSATTTNTWQTLTTAASGRYVQFYFQNPNNDTRLGYLSRSRSWRGHQRRRPQRRRYQDYECDHDTPTRTPSPTAAPTKSAPPTNTPISTVTATVTSTPSPTATKTIPRRLQQRRSPPPHRPDPDRDCDQPMPERRAQARRRQDGPPTSSPTATATGPTTLTFSPAIDAKVMQANPRPTTGMAPSWRWTEDPIPPSRSRTCGIPVTGVVGSVIRAKLRFYAATSTSGGPSLYTAGNDKVAGQQQDVADAQGRAGALARPGLRRAAGPAAAEVRQAGGAVVHRARREARDRHQGPRARAGRARRARCPGTTPCGSRPAPPTCPGRAGDRTCRPAARRAGRPRRRLAPARAPGPRGRRGGPPLPVRRARRRAHRAPAARRHAVPDVVLPDLPARSPARCRTLESRA